MLVVSRFRRVGPQESSWTSWWKFLAQSRAGDRMRGRSPNFATISGREAWLQLLVTLACVSFAQLQRRRR